MWWGTWETYLEAGGAPVHKLDRPLRLYGGNGSVHVLWNDVAPVDMTNTLSASPCVGLDPVSYYGVGYKMKRAQGQWGACLGA
jgi:hypothetical protein